MPALRAKSKMLTGYLEMLLTRRLTEQQHLNENSQNGQDSQNGGHSSANNAPLYSVTLLTPSDPDQRGAQLSVRFSKHVLKVFEELEKRGVVVSYILYFFLLDSYSNSTSLFCTVFFTLSIVRL
jgi:kynureninase